MQYLPTRCPYRMRGDELITLARICCKVEEIKLRLIECRICVVWYVQVVRKGYDLCGKKQAIPTCISMPTRIP